MPLALLLPREKTPIFFLPQTWSAPNPLERHDQVQKQHLQGHRRTLVTPNNLAVTL